MLVMKMMAELLMSISNSLSICFSIYFDFILKAKMICSVDSYLCIELTFFDVILMANVKS